MSESEQACIDIYNDFSKEEVSELQPSLFYAWEIGMNLLRKQPINLHKD